MPYLEGPKNAAVRADQENRGQFEREALPRQPAIATIIDAHLEDFGPMVTVRLL